jgi:hypothetical protein
MRIRQTLAFLVFASCVLVGVVKNRAAELPSEAPSAVRSGDWTISKSDEAGKVEFSLIEHHHGGTSSHQSDWSSSSFQGVDFSKSGRQDVHFTITRDAGKIDCEGFLNDGEGAGIFHFQPDPNYPLEMQSLGFSIDDEKQFGMAVQDVSLDFAKQMKGEHLSNLDADKLIAFHQAGYSPDEDTLIAMRIHGATPEWMAQLKQRGYDHIDLEKLIAFRIHGVSPEFIGKLQGLGYSHPDPDELIAMRIHNVTPEYISDMKSRGIHDLSIDQLVSMRIHGID